MALEFDITGNPPSLADIAAERDQAVKGRAIIRKKNIRYLLYILMIIAGILCFSFFGIAPTLNNPDTEPNLVASVAYFLPYLIFAVFFFGNNLHIKIIEKPRDILDATIAALKEVTHEEISEVIGSGQDAQNCVEIISYQNRVAAQGRSLVKAELDAMQRWLDEHRLAAESHT